MKLSNILKFNKKNQNNIYKEKKGYFPTPGSFLFTSDITNNYNLTLNLAQYYYRIMSPLSTAIDLIGDEFQSIKPMIFNREKKEFEESNPLINLLKIPNSDQTKTELFGSIIRFYQINGNAFLIALGNINTKPRELYSINPSTITAYESSKDMFVDYYIYQTTNVNIRFDRLEEKGRLRFVNKDGGLELWHIRDYGDNCFNRLWGLSRLNSIYLEIDQYFSSNKHNLSLLKKGIRSSGILSTEQTLTQPQRDALKLQINSDMAGDVNTGQIFLLDGGKFKFDELSKSLKDMDFKDLKKDLEKNIYNRLKIPLPLISTANQKFNNMFQAKLGLYDNTIIPLIEKIFNELTLFLFPRFNMDPKEDILWFNLFDVQVLKERHVIETVSLKEKGIITLNEARKALNYLDDIAGGDTIYQPINLVPLGSTQEIVENEKTINFKEVIKNIKYKNGDRLYRNN